MATPLLQTKLYIPPIRSELVSRPRLTERLNGDLNRKLTLISAPAGFGKSTLLSEWATGCGRPVAWLSLDEDDDDPTCFWAYVTAAVHTIYGDVGSTVLAPLHSPQPPPIKTVLTGWVNELAIYPRQIILVLDDYHVISNREIHGGIAFLLDHQPQQLHLVPRRERRDRPFRANCGPGRPARCAYENP